MSPTASAGPTRSSSSRDASSSAATSGCPAQLSARRWCAGLHRFRRRRVRHRPVRHRGRLLRDVRASRLRRRHHGHGEPQPAGLQRHEVRARGLAADQRRHRAAGHPQRSPSRGAVRRSPRARGERFAVDIMPAYIEHLLALRRSREAQPLKVVVQRGQRRRGLIIDQLEPHLPFEFIKVHHEPDGAFPNGVPNPMLEENRAAPVEAIRRARRRRRRSPGTAISTAASCSTSTAASSRATTSSACSPRLFLRARARRRDRARPAPHLEHARHRARSSAASPVQSQVRPRVHQGRRCARSTASTAAR